MRPDRRQLLLTLRSALAASLVPSFPALAARSLPPAALLVPLTGDHAALGRSMARATALVQGLDKKALLILDSGDTTESGAAAARAAVKQGAAILFGPLLSAQAHAVLSAAGGRPVVSFSNDAALLESGVFLMGITADQAVAPLLHYARGRGVRRIALATKTDPWGAQVSAAAMRVADTEGLVLAGMNTQVDAILVASIADAAVAAPAAKASGTQLLCAFAGLNGSQEPLAQIEGAWLSAPDPTPFADFAGRFEAQVGAAPGVIAGLAYDAAGIVSAMRKAGGEDRSALLSPAGYPGVCGALRFRENGSADRALVILAVEQGRYRIISA